MQLILYTVATLDPMDFFTISPVPVPIPIVYKNFTTCRDARAPALKDDIVLQRFSQLGIITPAKPCTPIGSLTLVCITCDPVLR